MKILSDFDGVLTDLTHESRRVMELFAAGLSLVAESAKVETLLSRVEEAMTREPHLHGWRYHGRITAFCNEDGFIRVNAAAAALDGWAVAGDEPASSTLWALRERKIASSFVELAQQSYVRMTSETAAGESQPADPETRPVIEELMRRGAHIVVVSNSGTDRIVDILSRAGLSPIAHGKGEGKLRIRGNARKFELGENPSTFAVGEYAVDTDRPVYEAILREERPDMVIGDVFSLDLALPSKLGIKPVLRKRNYTPAWSLKRFQSGAGQGNQEVSGVVVDRLDQLVGLG